MRLSAGALFPGHQDIRLAESRRRISGSRLPDWGLSDATLGASCPYVIPLELSDWVMLRFGWQTWLSPTCHWRDCTFGGLITCEWSARNSLTNHSLGRHPNCNGFCQLSLIETPTNTEVHRSLCKRKVFFQEGFVHAIFADGRVKIVIPSKLLKNGCTPPPTIGRPCIGTASPSIHYYLAICHTIIGKFSPELCG